MTQIPGLSKAQSLVVLETVKGGTRKEIGMRINLSWTTVRSHLYVAYAILGVKNRVQLALKVAEIKQQGDV